VQNVLTSEGELAEGEHYCVRTYVFPPPGRPVIPTSNRSPSGNLRTISPVSPREFSLTGWLSAAAPLRFSSLVPAFLDVLINVDVDRPTNYCVNSSSSIL
jgi:hypothetical protein